MKASGSHGPVSMGRMPTTPALHDLLRRIESEYHEMPGMCVTLPQAQRLWGLDTTTCSFVLTTLVERGILRRTAHGTYVRC
jgi:DNA-binding IclR family transcriptional regulator